MPTLNTSQEVIFNDFIAGNSIFITGPAGCGKSFLIDHIKTHCAAANINIGVTALTGAAACVINGQTLHGWSGIGLAQYPAAKLAANIFTKPPMYRRWRDTNVLIIDEISMMNGELFIKLDKVAQIVRGNNRFFGGLQIILSGDFAQLEPIEHNEVLIFETTLWQENISQHTHYMSEVMRQDDPIFKNLLCEIRLGIVTPECKTILKNRIITTENEANIAIDGSDQKIRATILYPHKKDVDRINLTELQCLVDAGNEHHEYVAVDLDNHGNSISDSDKTMLNKTCAAIEKLELAIGAQVMLTKNLDFDKGLVNGSRGVVVEFVNGRPVVVFDCGEKCEISQAIFEREKGKSVIKRQQYPLILAWAITIHKCQGATLTNVITDLSKVFCNAQSYVTLSRVKTLEGLFLLGINFGGIKCNPKVKKYYNELASRSK